jgi:predicted peptidase
MHHPLRPLLTCLTLLLLLLWATAASSVAAGSEPNDDSRFLRRVYTTHAGVQLPYRLALPQPLDSNQSYPLVVFLHGAAARGNDNQAPLEWGPRLIYTNSQTSRQPCILVVPQCPKGTGWVGGSGKGSDALSQTVELVRDVLSKELKIDSHRRYLTGVSMGGIGLWSFMSQHPGFFAAGVPVCAAGSPSAVTRESTGFPMWAFHSDDDHLIPVQSARDMVKTWRDQGGVARYTEYTGLKHSSWKKAYLEPELLPWLFQQTTPKSSQP